MKQLALSLTLLGATILSAQEAPPDKPGRIFNTVKQKLAAGKQVVGGTVEIPNINTYCAMAHSGYDFLWIEMQHSPITYQDAANMILACKGAPAMPFVRVPDATEGDIQKAVDMGAAGIIIPMVEDLQKVRNAIKFAKYPPVGKRSQGGGNYRAVWGEDYRQIANENIMIVAMIESPAGALLAAEMAAIPGVDVIFIASTDLSSFSGLKQGDPVYEGIVTKVLEATLKAGKKGHTYGGGPTLFYKNSSIRHGIGFNYFLMSQTRHNNYTAIHYVVYVVKTK